MTGSWQVDVSTEGMPQAVATAFANLNLLGTKYEFIAYLGSQVVNGTNHAVLAKQIVITDKNTDNIVLIIFNEKNDTLLPVAIERILEDGKTFGGTDVDVQTDIPKIAKTALKISLVGYVGARVKPFALLGTNMAKGTNYIFAAVLEPAWPVTEPEVALVIANPIAGDLRIIDILHSKLTSSLEYVF